MATVYSYILLDGALWQEDMDPARQAGASYRSLYRGKPAEELGSVAPYLFLLSGNKSFEEWVNNRVQRDPESRRVLRLESTLDIDELRRHLRRFLRVKTEDGKWLLFRLYDPYVINCVIPNLSDVQFNSLFQGIACIITEDGRINERRTFYLSPQGELIIARKGIQIG